MRIVVTVDDLRRSVDVDAAVGEVRLGERTHTVRIVDDSGARVVLEIDGEPATVEGWGSGLSSPKELVINGERFSVAVDRAQAESPTRRAPAIVAPPTPTKPSTIGRGSGVPVLPPMPGKVIEIRVKEGEVVAKGQVLLVVEAMKMRNEVTSPATGRVLAVSVATGASVKARETLLVIDPDRNAG